MKIGIFSAQYLPNYGGVERYTYQLAVRARSAGHDVFVLTSARQGLPQIEISPEGIRIYRLPAWLLMDGRFPVPKPNRVFGKLAQQIWAKDFDVCVIQTRFYPLSLYAARQAHRRGIPTMLIEHSTGHLQPEGKPARFIGHVYEHVSCWYIARYCKHFFGVSRNVCQWLEHFHVVADGVLYNAVDTAELDAILQQNAAMDWRRALALPANARIVLYAGRLIPEKGINELVDAFLVSCPETDTLLIAGDGPMLPSLQERFPSGGSVGVLGQLSHDELLTLLAQSDVFCLPSYSEGFPTTLLEAAACRCPVIASDVGGVRELICSEEYGVVLADVSMEKIAAALAYVLSNPAWRARAGALLRERVTDRFDWPVIGDAFVRVAERLAEEGCEDA